ncbi:glycosyltransferase involved in cell wall biosynthesis [Fluviicoccus keumensis]|uniref:Glycosyltransferase involved in cell wall biosynthesis n=1 Tax=Fluviicoccus keumensis TaxID=1435465 RepID=A0A4Q7YH73_9GAMM|nr:glycosyltransferase family 4 protein [Fluviicoccus keumensis]RZU36852.1 glycosyltransferase involved in cell wall biosynthesis [Fluviicoccus keumensis]
MRALFIHQNFPGQFSHLARHLARDRNNVIVGMGEKPAIERLGPGLPGVKLAGYELSRSVTQGVHSYLRGMEHNVLRGQSVVRACMALKKRGFTPDLVVAHAGWGEALYLRDIYPDAKIVGYMEFFYHAEGKDVGFDPEFPTEFDRRFLLRTRNATQLVSMTGLDHGWSPTEWQKSLYPAEYQPRIEVIHEGVDTELIRPDESAAWRLPNGQVLTRRDEVLTLVNRHMEPYRGFHVFMRALPAIQKARPNAVTLIVGDDQTGYGAAAPDGLTWRQAMLRELDGKLDLSRIHFLGPLPYPDFLRMLQVSRAHAYLTYPFVLSWSMLEAMASGCTLLASATPPVTEVVRHGENGLLFDFFDQDALAAQAIEVLAKPEAFAGIREGARHTAVTRYDQKTVTLPAQVAFAERLLGR